MCLQKVKTILKFILALIILALCIELIYRGALYSKSFFTYHGYEYDFNLCMVGGSTSLGVPFNKKVSIPRLVSFAFNDSINGHEIAIHNLSKAGMPISTAFWKTRDLVLGIDSGTMLLYVGINDPYLNENNNNSFWFKLMHKSWVVSKINYLLNPWNSSKQHYEFYYEEIIKMLQNKGWTIVNSTLVGNFSEFAPNVNDKNFYELDEFDFLIDKELNLSKPVFNSKNPFAYYKKGAAYLKQNNTDSINKYFQLAVDLDYSIRPSTFKNEFIMDIAKKYKIQTIDPYSLFLKKSNNILPGYNLFMDAHHPNLEGYILISQLFVEKIETIYNIKKTNYLDVEKVEKVFQLDTKFYDEANLNTAAWHISESFYSLYYEDRIEKARQYLNKIQNNNLLAKESSYWNCILLLLEEDFTMWESIYKTNMNQMDYSYPIKSVPYFDRLIKKINLGCQKGLIKENLANKFLSKLN